MSKMKGSDIAPCGMTYKEIWDAATTDSKHCIDCGKFKHKDQYSKSPNGTLKRVSRCKPCHSVYSINYNAIEENRDRRRERDAHPDRLASMRRSYVKRIYGEFGPAIEERRLNGDPCDVCGGKTERMSIDHCHKTGVARGLLCRDCNLTLGYVKDNPRLLRELALYLEEKGGDV